MQEPGQNQKPQWGNKRKQYRPVRIKGKTRQRKESSRIKQAETDVQSQTESKSNGS